MKVTILAISKKERITKNGPVMGLSLKTQEYGDKWLSGWENDTTGVWQKGDVVDVQVTENGQYLNFKPLAPSVEPEFAEDHRIDESQPDIVGEGIDKRHGERQDGMALGNAKTNACNIVVALINVNKVTTLEIAEEYIKKLTSFIFLIK